MPAQQEATPPDPGLRPAGLAARARRKEAQSRRTPRPHSVGRRVGNPALLATAAACAAATVVLLRAAPQNPAANPLASESVFWAAAFGVSVVAILAALLALLAAARQPRRRRGRLPDVERPPLRGLLAPLRWWQRAAWLAFAVALASGTFLLMRRIGRPEPASPSAAEDPGNQPGELPTLPEPGELTSIGVLAIGLLMVVAAILLVGAFVYSSKRAAAPEEPAPPAAPPPSEPAADALQDAAERGLAAVSARALDPRGAIIACYRAMEDALARTATAAPLDSDTASEVLARATLAGTFTTHHAADLVDLFNQARFSTHPMTERHRADAARHLRGLLAELGARGGT